ncbi:MAG: hypothetical protein ACJA07_001513 [Rhodococcus sp. (in: high G+C Gram-positive bacteria)]|jgi:hypothetical protein
MPENDMRLHAATVRDSAAQLLAALAALRSSLASVPSNDDLVGGTNDPTLTRAEARAHCGLQIAHIENSLAAVDEFTAELTIAVEQAALGL